MTKISFEELPQAVSNLADKLEKIERLLLVKSEEKTNQDEFLNIEQTAALLNLTVPTIYGYVHKLEIPYCKIKKRLYFKRNDLNEWIQSGRQKTISEINSSAHESMVKRK